MTAWCCSPFLSSSFTSSRERQGPIFLFCLWWPLSFYLPRKLFFSLPRNFSFLLTVRSVRRHVNHRHPGHLFFPPMCCSLSLVFIDAFGKFLKLVIIIWMVESSVRSSALEANNMYSTRSQVRFEICVRNQESWR
jgi:hypothetical protein